MKATGWFKTATITTSALLMGLSTTVTRCTSPVYSTVTLPGCSKGVPGLHARK
jgi:hypothetical protein